MIDVADSLKLTAISLFLRFKLFHFESHDFGYVYFIILSVGVLAVGDFSFYLHQFTFWKQALTYVCGFAPGDYIMPGGILYFLIVFVFVTFVGGQAEACFFTIFKVHHVYLLSYVSD